MATKKTTTTKKTEVKKAAPVASAQAAVATKQEVKTPVAAPEKKEPVKEPVKATTTTTDKKPVAAKATKTTKKPAASTAAKKTVKAKKEEEKIQEVFFEYGGDQILTEDIVERIKNTYKEEGHRISSIKSLRVYINPEERKAYYVINDKAEGKFVEF